VVGTVHVRSTTTDNLFESFFGDVRYSHNLLGSLIIINEKIEKEEYLYYTINVRQFAFFDN
jgi:hypothetical protein